MPVALLDKDMKKLIVQLVSCGDDPAQHLSVLKNIKRSIGNKLVENEDVSCLINQLNTEILSSDDQLVSEALSILNEIIDPHGKLCDKVTVDQQNNLLENLLEILGKSRQPDILKKCMLLLENQQFNESVVELFIDSILTATVLPQLHLENDTITVINRLLHQCPKEMEEHILLWMKPLVQLSAHNNSDTREMAMASLKGNMTMLVKHRKEILPDCTSALKQDVFPRLKQLAVKEETLKEILNCLLPLYMKVVGEYFKKSSSLLNLLLQFVEKGFRHNKDEIKCCAFNAWGCFIDTFAANKELLASPKYVKLLTQPLKLKFKSSELVKVRLKTLWKLVVCLEEKLLDLFEVVCKPLIQMCISQEQTSINIRRLSGRPSQDHISNHNPPPDEGLQELGVEMLAHLLLDVSKYNHAFKLQKLYCPLLAQATNFLRFQSFLMTCICDVICSSDIKMPDEFLHGFWDVLVKVAQDCISRKRDSDFFRSLYQTISQIVTSSTLKPELLLMFVSSLSKFPNKVLNSSLLYSSDKRHSGLMHGTVNLALLDLLLTPNIRKECIGHQKFFECGQSIILCGMERDMATLEFTHAVARHLSCDHIVYLKLWNFLTEQLMVYINKTGNINQGDSLEHDFSSIYDLVLFPIEFIVKGKCDVESFEETTIELWQSLVEKFLSLSTEVETSTPQEARNFIISNFLNQLSNTSDIILNNCTSKFFQAFAVSLVKNAVFPPKPVENKRRSLVGSNALVDFKSLIVKLLFQLGLLESSPESSPIVVNIMPALHCLFSILPPDHVTEFFISFSPMLATILQQDSQMLKSFQQDVEDCWKQILMRLPFTSILLEEESVLEVFSTSFQDSSSIIFRSTVEFWEMKVLENFEPTDLSSDFLSLLSIIYKKSGFKISWDNEHEKEDGKFNVSASSLQSSLDDEDDVVGESLVDVTRGSSQDDECDVTNQSQQSNECDDSFESHQRVKCDVTNESDDITQLSNENLDTSQSASDRSLEENNKSLNLRSLASSSQTKRKKVSPTSERRRSARLRKILPESEHLPTKKPKRSKKETRDVKRDDVKDEVVVLDDSDVSQDERFVSACDVTSTDTDDDVIDVDKSAYGVVDVAESSADQSRLQEEQDVDEEEKEVSMESDDTEIDKSSIDESVYEVVEMTDVSMTSSKPHNDESNLEDVDAEKSMYEYVEVADSSINPHHDKSISKQAEESIYEIVEMAEMSVNQTRPLEDEEQNDVEKSIYEMVEVAEVSIHPEHRDNLEESNIQEDTTDEDVSEREQDDVFVPATDASIYEDIQMAEMSINTTNLPDSSGEEETTADEEIKDEDKDEEQISDEEMKDVERELGIQPLDTSFDGDEEPMSAEKPDHPDEQPSLAPGKICVESPPEEEVTRRIETPNIKHFQDQSDKHDEVGAPLRRSLRKRVSTPKVVSSNKVSGLSEKGGNGRRTRQRILEQNTESEREIPKEANSPTKSKLDRNPVVVIVREEKHERTPDVESGVIADETPEVVSVEKPDGKTPTDEQQAVIAETPMIAGETITSKTEVRNVDSGTRQECNSPTSTGQNTEYVSTPKSCTANRLATLREEAALTPSSPGGILKRRVSEVPSPANKSRRVSFAEPISVSKVQEEMIPLSPNSSPHSEWRKNKFSSRIVSRRLSLPAPKRTVIAPRADDVTRSPMSVRSATVAAAIAGIKARGGDQNVQTQQSSPTSSVQTSSRDPTSPSKSIARVNQLTISQLSNQALLQNLSVSQLSHLTDSVLQAAPIIHAVLMHKIGKT